ncbi:MAG: Lsr2 family protein, partial [Curtobacterium sp.]
MTQRTTVTFIDDLTGEEIADGAGGTVQFGFDGNAYEIDLSETNKDSLREALSDFIAAARRVSGGTRTSRQSSSSRNDPAELAKVREWANQNGHEVSSRGR